MKRILVIEDDPDIGNIMDIALSDKYQVEIKTDGYHVKDAVESFNPDLIMLDNYVGQKNAYEIISELHQVDDLRKIPFVLFSGHEDIRQIAKKLKANAYLPKPFALDELYQCIGSILAS